MRLLILVLFCIALPQAGRAGEAVPQLRLLWAPAERILTLRFSTGCMSSSLRVTDNLSATVNEAELRLSGGFDSHGLLATADFGQCPTRDIPLTVAPGVYTVRYEGRPAGRVSLDDTPVEIALFLDPGLTLSDLRNAARHGANRIWDIPMRQMSPYYLAKAGPARTADSPGSLLIHVTPDPLLYWTPYRNRVEMRFRFGCLAPSHRYMGADPIVTLNRAKRTIAVSGHLRFLPLRPARTNLGCHPNPVLSLKFDDVPPGEYRIFQDGALLFTASFGRLDFNQDRFGVRLLE